MKVVRPDAIELVSHPDDAQLSAWVDGLLPEAESVLLEEHLEVCASCGDRLNSMTADDPFLVRLREAAGLGEAPPETTESDANLVFGALAIQAGFITPQQLADACVLWSTRDRAPLSAILLEQGWIDEKARRAITTLIHARKPSSVRQSDRLSVVSSDRETVSSSTKTKHSEGLELLELHSQGGIGQIWLAKEAVLGRTVALKELHPELRGSLRHRERFFREARVAAQLSHPGAAPVYEYHEVDGRCYYTMRFYSGKTLSEAIKEAHAAVKTRSAETTFEALYPLIDKFLDVCDTIAYAHTQGIVHRDLKGDNVVLGEFGEVTVVDWGLAKSIVGRTPAISPDPDSDKRDPTIDGERLGTPGFMAPEQARGDLSAIDERTDVYGLAAVLYEVLTCRPPFDGETANETMHHVETQPPTPPSVTHPGSPAELEAICLRNLAKRKEDRFSSAAELRDAVRSWLARMLTQQKDSERQSKFFSLSHDLFVALDDCGTVTQVNPAYERFCGYDSFGAEGSSYLALFHPDDAERAQRVFTNVQRGISQPDSIFRTRATQSGEYLPVSWSLTRVPAQTTIYAVGRPLDDEAERRRLANERRRLFSLSRDYFVACDEDFYITQVNNAAAEAMQLAPEDVVGEHALDRVHPDDLERASATIAALPTSGGSIQDIDVRLIASDGTHLNINWTLTRVAGEKTVYALGRLQGEAKHGSRCLVARHKPSESDTQ